MHDALLDLYSKGAIKPLTTRYAFADVSKAVDTIGDRTVVGRIAIGIE